ncbi:MAG: winged helix-turn-helix transcriptional regulator [Hyphomicrobiales bacterium]
MSKAAQETEKKPGSFGNSDEILLGVLSAIERDSNTSQRHISRELGVALGLANAYLKRSVRKGLIKIKQVPRRRYAYYLTPQGFAEKSRLAGEYFAASFNFFRSAREQMSGLMADCAGKGLSRIVFAGVSELAEVGTLCAYDHPIKFVAIVDAKRAGEIFCGLPVKAKLSDCGPFDVVIVTDLIAPAAAYQRLQTELSPDRVLAPRLLRIAKPKQVDRNVVTQAAE